MTSATNRFDQLLELLRSNELKSLGRLWGVAATRKDEILADIRQKRSDPAQVRAAVARLSPFERAALALTRWSGGMIDTVALMVALRASGIELPKARGAYERSDGTLLRRLMERGLFLSTYTSDPAYVPEYGAPMLLPDDQLLAHAGAPSYVPLTIEPVTDPSSSTYRRPSAVIMDTLALLQAIEQIGGLQLTKAGALRAGDLRKLNRVMGWNDKGIVFDEFQFPAPAIALIDALRYSGALTLQDDTLKITGTTDAFARRPYVEQVSGLLRGFLRSRSWREQKSESWFDSEGSYHAAGRLALIMVLMALPDIPGAFFAIDDLDQALFTRIGEYFALSFPPRPPYLYNKTAEEARREEQTWRTKLRAEWLKRERPWLGQALATWAVYFGLIELGSADGIPISFRLTQLGRAVLHPELALELDAAPEGTGPAWVVQPNFEVLVYLDRATPTQIALLERYAVREQTQQHIAHYRLTRETVYQGLERGASLQELVDGLQRGAGVALPQNVDFSIREWATQRERITLHKRASLLEFPDSVARQQALDGGLEGKPVGERYLLLGESPTQLPDHERIDYDQPLPRSLSVSETGIMTLVKSTRDLLIHPQLDVWAERLPDGTWQLTAERVAGAVKTGLAVSQLLALLQERLRHSLPPLLGVALHAWAGKPPQVALATVTALRCSNPTVFAAIAGSPLLAPYLRGTLAPDVLLVDTAHVSNLQAHLAWAGLRITESLEVQLETGRR